jgi:hypothetical protein
VLQVNLGRSAELVSAFSVLYPFVRTGMTGEYAENPKVFGRWQPRMLETFEAAESLLEVIAQPAQSTNGAMYECMVEGQEGAGEVKVRWQEVKLAAEETPVNFGAELVYR